MSARAVALALAMAFIGCSGSPDRADIRLQSTDVADGNWSQHGRTTDEQRHSPLAQINESTVNGLGLAWSVDLKTLRGIEATPLVHEGVLYTTTAWSVVYAIDARTGNILWSYDPKVPKEHGHYACCDVVNRGAALYDGKVYVGTLDGRLVALDARSGALAWEVRTTPGGAYTITGAPRIARGRVIIGNGGAEYGVRGYVTAYDAQTGKLVWRTYFVPGDPSRPFESEAMRRAAATWSGEWWKAGGGGTAWDAIVYDPSLDLIYVGTGNGTPWYRRIRSRGTGDNLYLSSIVALRATDGEIRWHYQTTPGDNWDYTATQPLMLVDLSIQGRQRRVIMQAPKNGFFYVIDRENGQFISAGKYGDVNWATGIDSTGRPIVPDSMRDPQDAVIVTPGPWGAHNWYPMSRNPETGFVYFAVQNASFLHVLDADWRYDPWGWNAGGGSYGGPKRAELARRPVSGHLVAWDPVRQREAWRVDHPVLTSGGTLSTAGNLVFQGRVDGKLSAYRATDGKVLWEFDTRIGIVAPPISYAIADTQYIAVMAGRGGPEILNNARRNNGLSAKPAALLAFKLGGSGALPSRDTTTRRVPRPSFQMAATRSDIEAGARLYGNCARCHGVAAISGGSVPDLRYASEATHREFQRIVLGARRELGMPSFEGRLTSAQIRQIQAYVLDRARQTAGQP